jgi:tRNA-uridine 2-sulfurtransferase
MSTAKPNNPKKVLIALSGGIDSAVSAYLLQKQGYQVEAAFMKNWSKTKGLKYDECPWLVDRQDALRVAAFLRIPMHTLDFEKQYEKTVLDYFFKEYSAGRTPNPDVMCNKEIKFKLVYNWALAHGFDYLATGHYAQIKPIKKRSTNGQRQSLALVRSKDEFKDQTYFIYNIKTQQLPHVLFPIGHMLKKEVRTLAHKIGLPNAAKKESMGLCFVGRIRLKDFLQQKLKVKTGKVVNTKGRVIGEHQGLAFYTIGQRQGIGIGGSEGPFYVVGKNLKTNMLTVTNKADDPALKIKYVEIHSVNWVTAPQKFPAKLKGRFRHQGELQKLTIDRVSKTSSHYAVTFSKPQKAVASGQSLVIYSGKTCLGGGIII